ncbi:phosphatidylglycerophosphatase A [Patescibacteria group bacterium]|nr:phosphatidylglycerophosphatase A [Patescibacteria group bacterium]
MEYDQKEIIIDEILGMLVAFAPLLKVKPHNYLLSAIILLILFRIFDILKPWGINRIDAGKTPHHILLDDYVAGLYSAGCYILINLMFPI